MAVDRLQKILARGGIASRRAAEELILAGRVRINGRVVTELGTKADAFKDRIEVDGKRVVAEAAVYVAIHKPRGVVSTMSDPEGRPTVAEILQPLGARVYPVGRLDFATSGILLATNDGDFANGLLHPKKNVPKTYVLKVAGEMKDADLDHWRNGVALEDGKTLPAQVKKLRIEAGKTWIEVTIHEGRNQQIRRMGEATGFPVMRLARTAFAGVTSEALPPGRMRPLTREELIHLKKEFGVPKRVVATAEIEEHGRGQRAPRRSAADTRRGGPDRVEGRGRAGAERGAERGREGGRGRAPAERGREGGRGRAPVERGREGERERGRGSAPAERGRSHQRDDARGKTHGRDRKGAPDRTRSPGPPRARKGPPGAREGSGQDRAPGKGPRDTGRGGEKERFGGGAPGRRPYDREQWGSGSGRGHSGPQDERGPRPDDTPPGRGGRTRTTGTSGGVGAAGEGNYRMERGRRRR